MASARYTLNITPEEPEKKHEMTPKEKAQNYWHYHKWYYITALIVIALIGSFVYEIVTKVEPDYQFGVLSSQMMDTSTLERLEVQLAQFADDRNGDGRVSVAVMDYTLQPAQDVASDVSSNSGMTVDPYTQMAGMTKLSADLQSGSTMLFFTNDVESYQKQFGLFAYNDGTTPPEGEPADFSRLGVAWTDCPLLTGLDLGNLELLDGSQGVAIQDIMANFVLVQRTIEDTAVEQKEESIAYAQDAAKLFDRLTAQ